VLHPHVGTYVETDEEIQSTFDALDTSLVGMCLDTGHALFGGADPTALLAEYGDIVRHVHVKDCDRDLLREVGKEGGGLEEATARGVFCELGRTAALDGFLDDLTARGYEGWLVVEQDRVLTPEDTPEALLALQTRNREWLTARGF
jgi:inosose dehydratase